MTDALSNTTGYTVDNLGQVTVITNPVGGQTTMTYDAAGNLASATDPNHNQTQTQYDALGRQTKVTYPDGGVATYAYDRSGLLTEEVKPGNVRTTYAYDQAGRLVGQTDNLGATTRFVYDQAGNQILTFLPNGSLGRQDYDELGRTIRSYDGVNLNPDGTPIAGARFTQSGYDVVGNLTSIQLPNGYTATATYDLANRVTKVTEPPATTSYTYDLLGRKLTLQDGKGNWTRYAYDGLGRLVQVHDALNLTFGQPITGALFTSYEYDKLGHQTAVTDPLGSTTRTVYNPMGLPIQVTDPLGQVTVVNYDSAGRPVSTLDRNGNLTMYEFDPMGRQTAIRYQDDCSGTKFAYDAAGRRTSATCSCGTTYYQYDGVGRLIKEATPNGSIEYEYDAAGLRTAVKLAEGKTTYQYDRANRLTQMTDFGGSTTVLNYAVTGELAQINYPNNENEQITTDPWTNRTTGRSFLYQNVGGSTTLQTMGYKYDVVGNITSITNSYDYPAVVNYQYDALNRLVSDGTSAHAYDAAGNRTSAGTVTYQYGKGSLLLSSTSGTAVTLYSYDGEGHLIQVSKPDGTADRYTYNSRGLLTRVQQGNTYTYNAYDPDGRRTSRRVTTVSSGAQEVVSSSINYQYDGIRVVAIRDTDNGLREAYARMADGRLATWYAPGQIAGDKGWFVLDHLGSVLKTRGLFKTIDTNTFDAFGNGGGTSNGINELKFTGAPTDSSGLVHLNARFYNPSIGRFMTQDTWKGNPWQPWTQNLYTYVGNNPVNYVDPTGHFAFAIPALYWGAGALLGAAGISVTPWGQEKLGEFGEWLGSMWAAKTAIDVTSVDSLKKAIETDYYTVNASIFRRFQNDCNSHGQAVGANPNGGRCTAEQAAKFIAGAVLNAATAMKEEAGTILEYTYQQGAKMTAYIYNGFVTVKDAAGVITGYWEFDAAKMADITRDGYTIIKGTYP